MYPQISIRDEEEKELVERELTEESGIEYLIRGLHGTGGMDTVFLELYSWYKRDEKWKEKVESLLKAGYYRQGQWPGSFTERILRTVLPGWSVSRSVRLRIFLPTG